jgi:hypothetical protein
MKSCKSCGNSIPRKVPHTQKKTKNNRLLCYNCSPVRKPAQNHGNVVRSERLRRKKALVKMLGGCCTECGYSKSIRALSFHHVNPERKCFDISSNGNLMKPWEEVIEEANKCCLLCLNCHAELHNTNNGKKMKAKLKAHKTYKKK